MDGVLENLRSNVGELVVPGLVFIALAIVIKRRQVLEGLKAARREIGTNLGLMLFNALILVPLMALPVTMLRDAMPRFEALLGFWDAVPAVLTLLGPSRRSTLPPIGVTASNTAPRCGGSTPRITPTRR